MQAVLIGLGMVADMHAEAVAATGGAVTLRGVHARDPAKVQAFADRRGSGLRCYGSVAEIVADGAPDFAIVATPPDARAEIIGPLAEAGLPVLLEKPIERDYARAAEIVALCETAAVPLGIVLQHRMRAAARHLRGLLREGALGQIATVEVAMPWWRPQSYYDAPGRGTYARDGGGVLITQAIHTLDLMLHLCGPVTRVQALTGTSALHRMEAEDIAAAGLSFANGAIGSVMASTASFPGREEQIVVNGTKGAAVLNAAALTLHWQDGRTEEVGAAVATGGGADPMAFSHEWHQAIIADFAGAIAAKRAPAAPGREALAVQALIDAMQLSSAEGRAVDLAEITGG